MTEKWKHTYEPFTITPSARTKLVQKESSAWPPVFVFRRGPSCRRFPGGPAAWTCTWPAGCPGRLPENGTRPADRLPRPSPQGLGGSGPTRRRRRRARWGSKRSRTTSWLRLSRRRAPSESSFAEVNTIKWRSN